MGIVERPMVLVEQDYLCDDCHVGKLRPSGPGRHYATMPPRVEYQHRCSNCGAERVFVNITFPCITPRPA